MKLMVVLVAAMGWHSVCFGQEISVGIQCVSIDAAKKLLRNADRPDLATALPRTRIGVYVVEVTPGGGMETAGVRSGDLITKIDKSVIKSTDDLQSWAKKAVVGKGYIVTLKRRDERNKWRTISFTLRATERKGDAAQNKPDSTAIAEWQHWENQQAQLHVNDRAYEIKGDRLGMTLRMFKAKHYRSVPNEIKSIPFCSDEHPHDDNPSLFYMGEFAKAGIVHARTNFPYEQLRTENPIFATIAGAKADPFIYAFVDGKLYQMTIFFDHNDYDQVMDAMRAKYGDPTVTQVRTYQNAFGASFKGDVVAWNNSSSEISVFERAGKTDQSLALITHNELYRLAQDRIRIALPPRTDDL